MAGNGGKNERTITESWGQVLAGGGLLLAVAAILIAAAVLETPDAPARPASPSARTVDSPSSPSEAKWQPVAAPLTVPIEAPGPAVVEREADEPPLDPLAQRVLVDPGRLRRTGAAFTAQLAFACRRDTVERILERAGVADDLYVLPEARDGQDCFRVCWGAFPSREEALRASGLPPRLGEGLGKPDAKRIAELGL